MRIAIVHGEKPLRSGAMHPEFANRLEAAVALTAREAIDRVYVTGGPTRPDVVSEAEAGAAYLDGRIGVPLVLEPIARTTSENIRNVRRMTEGEPLERVFVISSAKRMPRIRMFYARLWPERYRRFVFLGAPDRYPWYFWPKELVLLVLAAADPRELSVAKLGRRWFRNG